MTSIIKFQSLSGVSGESPPCYILQVDEFRFLLDCGWDDRLGIPYLEELKKHIQKIDAVLITYPDLLHMGALPTLVRCGLSCPIYTTVPVHKMGQMFFYDYYISRHNEQDFKDFDLDDIDLAFDCITQIKYNQTVNLTGKGFGLTIAPLPAGHMIGGTIWKIVKLGEEEDIYYAVDYNHKKERHLNGCDLGKINKPSLFITDAYNANYIQERRGIRDGQLLAGILHTLRNGGNVIIAVDTAGRVLELAHMLDQLWRTKDSGLHPYSLALINNLAYNVIEFAKSQIEWMSDNLMRSFEGARNNPFQFKHLQICHNIIELQKISSPKVVLASSPDMEFGFARELFLNWCQDKKNCLILTSRPSEGTIGRLLIDNPKPGIVELEVRKRVQLRGRELESHYRHLREEEYRIKKEKMETMMESDDDDDDEDMEIKIMEIVHGNKVNHDLFIKAGMEAKIDTGSLFKAARSKYPMFPHIEEKIKFDDYGEFIKTDDYFLIDNIYEKEVVEKSTVRRDSAENEVVLPTKCISHLQKFDVQCSIIFIDFEGRSDGESIQKILEHMKPRRLIITRGPEESVKVLTSVCSQVSPETVIYTPQNREILDVTSETHIYQVKLKDALVSSLELQRGKDAELAWVEGYLIIESENHHKDEIQAKTAVATMENDEDNLFTCLEPMPLSEMTPHSTVFINEIKLSDFKQVLAKHGLSSEFSGGVLWCAQGTVALRRQDAGKLTVEGALSEEFYKIRELLYDQYAIL